MQNTERKIICKMNNSVDIEELDQSTTEQSQPVWDWSINNTKRLIELYKEFKPKLGTHSIKSMKKLWEVIAEKMNGPVTPERCENKWKVLLRAYKKYVDNQRCTGRGRKFFAYAEDMDNIFKGKINVKPILLLSNNTIDNSSLDVGNICETNISKSSFQQKATPLRHIRPKQINNPVLNTNSTLEKMRLDRKEYYKERLKQENEKIEILKARNALLLEKNQILLNRICPSCLKRPTLE